MKKITGHEPAHPIDGMYAADAMKENIIGITIRQHYAGLAMQAYISAEPNRNEKYIANDAVRHADALIAELNR